MYYRSVQDICFSDACLALVLASLFCAAILWVRTRRACGGRHSDCHSRAHRRAALLLAAAALQIPYAVHPGDTATWIYAQVFGVVFYPACLAALARQCPGRRRRFRLLEDIAFTALPLAFLCALGVWSQAGGCAVVSHSAPIRVAAVAAGLAPAAYSLAASRRLGKVSPRLAGKMTCAQLSCLSAMWCILLSGSQWVKFCVDIALAVCMVAFLAMASCPRRESGAEAGPGKSREPETAGEKHIAIRGEVADIIRRMYRDSGLRKADVIAEMRYGKKTLAKAYLAEVGFHNFVNAYRLEHARLYKEAHPQATLDETATAAGFRDRFALLYAKRKAKATDNLLIGDFVPERL